MNKSGFSQRPTQKQSGRKVNGVWKAWDIPDDVLIPVARETQRRLECTIENMVTYDIESMKRECGPEYGHVPIDDIRQQATNLRKSSRLGSVSGHGPGLVEPTLSIEYETYLKSREWQEYRQQIIEFWEGRCALCYAPQAGDVHHRTYKRIGEELATDCVLLCRNCHKAADQRRWRQTSRADDDVLFE